MTLSIRSAGREVATAARLLVRRPVFGGLAVALFALSIGAIATIFAIVDVTMLRPLPYLHPDDLVAATGTEPTGPGARLDMALGYFQFARWRSDNRVFTAFEGFTPATMKFLGGTSPEPVVGALVSAGFFDVLGWSPERGRAFTQAEELPNADVVVISYALWQRRFAGDPAIVGKVINIDEVPRAIIGVMPRDFTMPLQPADAWMPLPLTSQQQALKARLIRGVGRLRPGVTLQQAIADLESVTSVLGTERPDEYKFTGVKATSLREALFGRQKTTLLALLAAGFVLLAVATVNVISLAFGDAIARRIATMTRIAFGAERRHIVRLRLLEFGVIAAAGCAIGVGLAWAGLRALESTAPDALAGVRDASVNASVVGVAALVALVAGLVAGVPTAILESTFTLAGLAGSSTKSIGGPRERRLRDGLLVVQVGLAVVLLVGAALLGRNVRALLNRPTGFQTDGVSVVELTFSPTTYKTVVDRAQHAQQLIDAVKAVPGVSAAATIQTRFVLNETMQTLFEIEGRPMPTGAQRYVNIRHVTPEVADVLGLRLRRGRMFTANDRVDSPLVAVVSTQFAATYWPGEDPIGRRIRRVTSQPTPWMEVIGVVDDIRDAGAGVDMGPALFVSFLQQNTAMARPTIVVRSGVSAASLFPSLRRAIWSVDANQTIDSIAQLDELMLKSAAQPRFAALVGGLLASSAIILVLGGIYAVTLYGVVRRTREIGVRAALGAGPASLVWTTVRQSVTPIVIGVALGAAVSVPAVQWMRPILAQRVSIEDMPMLAIVIVVTVLASMTAALIPARRALAVPPSIAMRDAG